MTGGMNTQNLNHAQDKATSLGLTKKQKGKLKKLLNRALTTSMASTGGTGHITGITCFEEADEFRSLLKQSQKNHSVGPSILLANPNNSSSDALAQPWNQTESTEHRDLIQALVFQSGSKSHIASKKNAKKRKRSSNRSNNVTPTYSWTPRNVPSWVRIHNAACMESIAVIEFFIHSKSQDSDASVSIMPSFRIQHSSTEKNDSSNPIPILTSLTSKDGYKGRKALPLNMLLFQGDRPRHLTDMLMYIRNISIDNAESESTYHKMSSSQEPNDIISLLRPLLLSWKDMKREGYPMCNDINTNSKKEGLKRDSVDDDLGSILAVMIKVANEISTKRFKNDTCLPFTASEALSLVHKVQVVDKSNQDQDDKNDTNGEDVENNIIYVTPILTSGQIKSRAKSAVFGLDCEMVRTSAGSELARVTLIQLNPTDNDVEAVKVVLDSLVKPRRSVQDYLTQYSGITAKMLHGVSTRLEEIQATLLALICKDDILVGHSLENDLRVLGLVHGYIVDTAILFRGEDCRKHSLKHLSACLLQRKIQQGHTGVISSSVGHCSEEDAVASLILAIRRARLGPVFKLHDKRQGRKNIMDVMTSVRRGCTENQNKFLSTKSGPLVVLGPDEWIKEHVSCMSAANALVCENIHSSSVNALNSYLRHGQRRASMLWARLVVDSSEVDRSNKKIDEILEKIIECDSSTAVLITFQRGYNFAKSLSKIRTARKDTRSTLTWSTKHEEQWAAAVDISKKGEALWIGV